MTEPTAARQPAGRAPWTASFMASASGDEGEALFRAALTQGFGQPAGQRQSGGGASTSSGAVLASGGGPATASAAATPAAIWAVGADAGGQPRVKVFDAATGKEQFSFLAYASSFRGGVRVAVGDVNGDGTNDIITGVGPGGGSTVRVFDGRNGNRFTTPIGHFNSFSSAETDGVFVAAGDVNGDGKADLVVGTEAGARGQVKVFSGRDGSVLASFALDTTGGVRVAAGDVNGDGKADSIAAHGPGGPPRVQVFDGGTRAELFNFFAFDQTFRGGLSYVHPMILSDPVEWGGHFHGTETLSSR